MNPSRLKALPIEGRCEAETFTIEGFFKSKGRIEAKTLKIEGCTGPLETSRLKRLSLTGF